MSIHNISLTTQLKNTSRELKQHQPSNKQYKRFIVLPYVSRKTEDFAFKLINLVETNYSTVDFNVVFKTPNTI